MIAALTLVLTGRGPLMCRMPRLLQGRQFLLLIRRKDLIDLGHRRAADRRELAHFATLCRRELLDLGCVVGLNRGPQCLPGLLQLLPDRLSRLMRRLENRLCLRLLGIRQTKCFEKSAVPAVSVTTGRRSLGR